MEALITMQPSRCIVEIRPHCAINTKLLAGVDYQTIGMSCVTKQQNKYVLMSKLLIQSVTNPILSERD